ncbi:MAG: hypothetical protein LWW75_02715, partial [Chlorobiales bacterium]|nr:hypothetical protein [Chlorobiales bacterium]
MALSFRVNNDSDFGGVFQTDDYNKGARLEIHDGIASLVVANSHKDDGYDIYVIPEKILKNRWYGLEIEVQNHGYVNLTLDGKKYFQINDRGVFASMSHIVIGRGFDEDRTFDGSIGNIEARTGDCSKFLLILKRIYNLQNETYFRFFGAILVLLLVVIFWRNGHLSGVATPVRRVIKDVRPFSLPLLLMVQAALIWRYEAYRAVISGYVLLFVMGGVLYPLIAPPGVMRQRSIYVIWPVIGLTYLSIFGGYLIGYSVDSSFYLTACLASLSIMTLINLMFNRTRFMAA